MHRILRTLLCSFSLIIGLTACGQKSDLYLPSDAAVSSSTPTSMQQQEFTLPS